jgi:L-lactate dehydrogenase complex protein LldG
MNESRQKILNNINQALKNPSQVPSMPEGTDEAIMDGLATITPKDHEGLLSQFQQELEKVTGEFHRVNSVEDIAKIITVVLSEENFKSVAIAGPGIQADVAQHVLNSNPQINLIDVAPMEFENRRDKLAATETAIVKANYAIADLGSIVILYDETPSNIINFLSDCIFAIVSASTVVANQFAFFEKIPPQKAKDMVFVTGPSRTADIEKILVLGAHGPRRLVVFMID